MGLPGAHIAIIGGGPAGCAAAFALARAGWRITLFEARAFPRAKVCGEFVSPAATDLLERIVPRESLVRAGARRVDSFVIELGRRERVFRMPTPAWALSRRALDAELVARASGAGAGVIQPATVREVAYGGARVRITLSDGSALEADGVIHADGSGRHDPAGPVPCDSRLAGHKCHLRIPGGVVGVRIRACRGGYIGTIAVEDGMATCALAARRSLIRSFAGDTDAMVRSMWSGFDPSWREGPWLACGIARSGYIAPGHPRSLRIGNAAGAVDPVGGEGIGLALWSGLAAAEQLIAAGGSFAAAERSLGRMYRRRLRARRLACRAAGAALVRPWIVRGAWPTLGWPTIGAWYAMTGKPLAARSGRDPMVVACPRS